MLEAVYPKGNTIVKGNSSEGIILAAYLRAGFVVSIPFGNGAAYDLIIDTGERLLKIQVKTGWRSRGCLFYKNRRRIRDTSRNGMRKYKAEEFDYLAIYDPQSDAIYVVPSIMMEADGRLRLEPSQNGQEKLVKWASNYTWERHIASLKPSPEI
jgi:hypothetical protein